MAQRRTSYARRMRRHLGIAGASGTVVALSIVALLAAVTGASVQLSRQGYTIERAVEPSSTQDRADAQAEAGSEVAPEVEDEDESHYLVHVDGAVSNAGVVELTGSDLRVNDAILACGGLLDDADTSGVNLAEPLSDGAKIHIPFAGESEGSAQLSGQNMTSGATGVGNAITLVNINTADLEALQTLTGVGEATAAAIIDERERNGPYASPEDLMRVPGIGEKKYEKVRDHICV